mgnify:CR=1 FL=1
MKHLLVFLFFLLVSCKPSKLEVEQTESAVDYRSWETWEECSQQIDDHPCNFSLVNQHGEEVELYDFYGKIIIVDLSAMWCGPCAIMGRAADPIVEEYGAENVEWLTIIVDNEQGNPPDQDDILRWATMNNITGHVLAGDRSFIATDEELRTGYPISGWPTYVVVNQEMVLKYGVAGWSEALLRSQIDSLL